MDVDFGSMSMAEYRHHLQREIIAAAENRIRVCRMYLGQRALAGQNYVVVSTAWSGRGIYAADDHNTALGPFVNRMPTLFSAEDAERLRDQWNAHLEGEGEVRERLVIMHHRDWWQAELDQALSVLADAKRELGEEAA